MQFGRHVTLIDGDHIYQSRIIDYHGKYIFLDIPVNVNNRKTVFLQAGVRLTINYVGDDGACYEFSTKIVKQTFTKIPKIVVTAPENVKRIQRREFVRIQTAVDVAIHSQSETFAPFTTVTHDISGGGLALILPANRQLPIGEYANVYIVLHMYDGNIYYVSALSKILRINEHTGGLTTASLQFKKIIPQNQQKIIQFCLEKQREERQKEIE